MDPKAQQLLSIPDVAVKAVFSTMNVVSVHVFFSEGLFHVSNDK